MVFIFCDEVIIFFDVVIDKEIYGDVDIKEVVEYVEDKNVGNIFVLDGVVVVEIELFCLMFFEEFVIEERKLLCKVGWFDFFLLIEDVVLIFILY